MNGYECCTEIENKSGNIIGKIQRTLGKYIFNFLNEFGNNLQNGHNWSRRDRGGNYLPHGGL